MIRLSTTTSLLALAACVTAPALAQDGTSDGAAAAQQAPETDAPAADGASTGEIVVTAQRTRGEVDTDVPPVLELSAEDVASYGAGSIEDLIDQLAPQTGSGRGRGEGRPVFLINGQRVGGFREFRRYPPEAIEKVQVLPEEVALQFGYPADQRVINIILKENFASREVELEYGQPEQGGTSNQEIELSQLTISGSRRLNIGAEYSTNSLLTEAERGIVQTTGSAPTIASDPDPAPFRSLRASSDDVKVDASLNSTLGQAPGSGTFSINGAVERTTSRSLSGLDVVTLTDGADSAVRTLDDDPLERRSRSTTYSLGGSLNKPLGDWQFDATLDASRADRTTLIDQRRDTSALQDLVDAGELGIADPLPTIPAAGIDRADSTSYSVDSKATLRGNPFTLPAGEARLTLNTGYSWNRIKSTDTRASDAELAQTRGDLSAGFNLGVPIASEREGFLAALGELNLNLAAGVDHLSDFGTLANATAGLAWRPTERLSLQASYIYKEAAPSLSQLGDPVVTDFNVPVYDFARGQSVLVTTISGGNPDLTAEKQRDIELAANYELDLFDRANIVVEYFRNRSDDVTQSFPLLTPAIEAAFPDRVVRDGAGNLVSIDRRPITFAGTKSSRLRYGINVFGKLGKAPDETAGESDGNRGGGWRGRMAASAPQAPANGGEGPPASGAPSAAGAPTGQDAAQGRRFDPARMEAMRQAFCAAPAGEMPDLSAVPERMLERLKGEDGQIDPAKVAALRERFCSAEGAAAGGQFRRLDPAQFAAPRETLCANPNAPIDVATLPEQVQARLKDANGQVDPARLAEFRTRVCAMPAPQAGEGDGERRGRGGDGASSRGGGGGERRGGRGGGGFGGGRGGPGDQGRWNLGLYHTIEFENEVLVAPGGPLLDQLSGQAFGNGIPRHKIELEGGLFYKGFGLRLSGNYKSATRVDGSGLPGSQDLYFHDIAQFDLRAFVNLEQQDWLTGGGEDKGFWKGARLSFRVDNLFDAQQRVTDGSGTVPLSYQPKLIDPLGRTFEIEFRKLF